MDKHTQAVRFEVTFPSIRQADRETVYTRLFGVSSDLTAAANRMISIAWMERLKLIALPVEAPRRPKEGQSLDAKPWPLASALYRLVSGEWTPLGDANPIYTAKRGPAIGGGVISALAKVVEVRIKEDWFDVVRGKNSLPTFKGMPIPLRAQEIRLCENGNIRLAVFAAATKLGPVTVRPKKLDASTREILRRCQDGTYKAGSATFKWEQPEGRRGKWMFAMSYTRPAVDEAALTTAASAAIASDEPELVAGIDIGIHHAVWIAYTHLDGTPAGIRPDVIQFPARTLRAVARIKNERNQRAEFNRLDLDLRSGRGRNRKLRPLVAIGDKVERLNSTMIDQIIAGAFAKIKRHNVKVVSVENHSDWSVAGMQRKADRASTRSEAAMIRTDYFRWHQGEFRAKFEHVASREAYEFFAVDAAWTSRRCHRCGLVWKRYGLHAPPGATDLVKSQGRFEYRRFRCVGEHQETTKEHGLVVRQGCGYAGHADDNAGHNIGQLGARAHRGEVEPSIAPVRGRKKNILASTVDATVSAK